MNRQQCALVILGTRSDPHVLAVAEEMRKRGQARVFVLDYHNDTRISLCVDEDGTIEIRVDGERVPDNVLVWNRPKIIPHTALYIRGGDAASADYAAQEWLALYRLIGGLHGERTVNPLSAMRCLVKPYQQVIAARAGFHVPATLVTNDRDSVLAFQCASASGLILKSLSGAMIKPAGEGGAHCCNVMTMRISGSDLESASEAELAYCPHFFQDEIRKSHELRVVVVGEHVHAFRIDSQARKSSEVDWRKGTDLIEYAPHALDAGVEAKIRAFMRWMGLFTGSIDLIVNRDGQTWFVECNPDGQWGWLDDIVSGAITRAFADAFGKRLDELGRVPACA